MEKFSTWRDGGTGIQPFLPIRPPTQTQDITAKLVSYSKSFLFQPLLFLLKLPFLIISFALTWLVYSIIELLPNSNFKLILKSTLLSPLLRLNLFLFGFFNIGFKLETSKKGRSSRNKIEYSKPSHGDIIICNFSSYLDVLYLYQKFQPTFTKCYPNETKLKIINEWELIKTCHLPQKLSPKDANYSLDDLVKKAKDEKLGPIVIFPEGVTSNGRGLLKFNPVFQKLKALPNAYLVILKYKFQNFPPTFSCGNKFYHFYNLVAQVYNQLSVQLLNSRELATNFNNQSLQRYDNFIKDQIQEISRFRQCSIGEVEKSAFLEYYNSSKTKLN